MSPFDYVRPATIAEAVAAGAAPGAAYLAAGTNLLDLMKGGVARPTRLVDVTRLPGLDRIEALPDGGVRIGALMRNADLAHDPDFARRFPAVAEALLSGRFGAAAQRRDGRRQSSPAHALRLFLRRRERLQQARAGRRLRRAGRRRRGCTRCSAGATQCIATHPSDFCVPLAALDAVVEIEGKAGRREIRAGELPSPARRRARARQRARAGRIDPRACGCRARRRPSPAHARYLKLRDRTSYAFAVVSAAAALRIADGRDRRGADRARRRRGQALARARRGGKRSPARGRTPRPSAAPPRRRSPRRSPSGDNAFKIELARRIVARALALAAAGTPARMPALPASAFASPPEFSRMSEIALTRSPAHVRHGSNIGQPLTRREGVAEGHRRARVTPPTTTRPACSTP